MKKVGLIVLLLMAGLLMAQNAFAEDVYDMANSEEYGKKFGGMLGRGLVNVATCFVDIIVQTVDGTEQGPPVVGTLTGLGGGIGCGALRVSSGALDVVTSWVPGFNGIPVSRSYSNCLEEPEYVAPASSLSSYDSPVVAEQVPAARASDPSNYVKK